MGVAVIDDIEDIIRDEIWDKGREVASENITSAFQATMKMILRKEARTEQEILTAFIQNLWWFAFGGI